jgi:hypothetical protein
MDETSNKREGRVGDLPPAVVNCQRVAALLNLDDLGHSDAVLLLMKGRIRDGPGTVLSFSPEMMRVRSRKGRSTRYWSLGC